MPLGLHLYDPQYLEHLVEVCNPTLSIFYLTQNLIKKKILSSFASLNSFTLPSSPLLTLWLNTLINCSHHLLLHQNRHNLFHILFLSCVIWFSYVYWDYLLKISCVTMVAKKRVYVDFIHRPQRLLVFLRRITFQTFMERALMYTSTQHLT